MAGAHEYVSFVFLLGENFHTRYFHSEGRDDAGSSLSVVAGPAFFQYAVFDAGFSRLAELAHVECRDHDTLLNDPAQLTLLFQNFSLARQKFEKVNVAVLNNDFVMMPPAFAGHADAKQALGFTGRAVERSVTVTHNIKEIEFCWRQSPEVMQVVERAFSNASVRHAGAVAMQLLWDHTALGHCRVLLNVHAGMTEIVMRNDSEILFYNVFPVSTVEDTLYYLLFSAEQFSIDPSQLNLAVAGIVPQASELATYLKRYTSDITFVPQHPGLTAAGKLRDIPMHYYFTLLSQHLCEL